ncbi:MAG: N-acetylmuramoyl-L-alanine amidase [Clostridia bacterium]|nr:N-acetylmuramoyl-L-alanine amidase [Clostridia bacterium]
MKTRLLSFIIILSILLTFPFSVAARGISLVVDGKTVDCDVAPVIRNDRTLVPVRALFDCFGADISWEESTKKVTVNANGTEIVLTIGSNIAYVNSVPNRLDSAPILVSDRTMVPVRFISEALNYEVSWDSAYHIVYIKSPEDVTVSSTRITSMMYSVSGKELVVKFTFSNPLSSYRIYNMDNPVRTVLELDGASYSGSKNIEVSSGGIQRIRTANHDSYYKVVADLDEVLYKNFVLSSNKLSATLSFTGTSEIDTSKIKTDLSSTNDVATEDKEEEIEIVYDKYWNVTDDSVVVLDAGHGGSDVGAIAYDQYGTKIIYEKDVNLHITLEVARILKEHGIRVMLTRSSDSATALSQRYSFSNANDALLFVSIHHNSHTTPNPSGALTLYSEKKDIKYPNLKSSKSIANIIQQHLVEHTGLKNGGIRSEDELAVLRGTTTSAVLVEVAFLSNYSDQEFLLSEDNLNIAAAGIASGILDVLDK